MIENKGIYFRSVAAVADDDDIDASYCWPAQNLKGVAHVTTGTLVAFYFKPLHDANNLPTDSQLDVVYLNVNGSSKGVTVMRHFFEELQTGSSPLITVFDEVDDSSFITNYGLTVGSYISGISSVVINRS